MPDSVLENHLLEDLAIVIAALEAARSLGERASNLSDARGMQEVTLALGGLRALLDLAVQHQNQLESLLRQLTVQPTGEVCAAS